MARHRAPPNVSWPSRAAPDLTRFNRFCPQSSKEKIVDDAPTTLLLRANLKQLRLPTMLAEYEKLAREAAARNEPYEPTCCV